jgi:FAD synthetase
MKKILLFGAFDFIHAGHLHVLREARSLGTALIVAVAQSTVIEQLKEKPPIHTLEERMALVSALGIADDVLAGDHAIGSYDILRAVRPTCIAVGYDQRALEEDVKKHTVEQALDIDVIRLTEYEYASRKSGMLRSMLTV